jgi:hypothetical protein
MGETTNRACFVAGEVNPRPPGPPADPFRPSHQAGRAQHAWGGRVHVRPTCTLSGTSYVRAGTVGSRRKRARRVLRRIVGPRGQNPSVESMYRVPGQWHRQWTALDLIERALNMCYFRGAAKHGLGVLTRLGIRTESDNAHTLGRFERTGSAFCLRPSRGCSYEKLRTATCIRTVLIYVSPFRKGFRLCQRERERERERVY